MEKDLATEPSPTDFKTWNELLERVEEYRIRCRVTGRAHHYAYDLYSRRAQLLGVPVVLLTALVGTAIFGTLQSNPAIGWKILVGCVSVTATLLSSLQTYLNYGERAEQHRAAGRRYASLRRKHDLAILQIRHAGLEDRERVMDLFRDLVSSADEAASRSPLIPDRAWNRALADVRSGKRSVSAIAKSLLSMASDPHSSL